MTKRIFCLLLPALLVGQTNGRDVVRDGSGKVQIGSTTLDATKGISAPNLINVCTFAGADTGIKCAAALAASPAGSILDARSCAAGGFTTVSVNKSAHFILPPGALHCTGDCFTQASGGCFTIRTIIEGSGTEATPGTSLVATGTSSGLNLVDSCSLRVFNLTLDASGSTGWGAKIASVSPGSTTAKRIIFENVGVQARNGIWLNDVESATFDNIYAHGDLSGVGLRIDHSQSAGISVTNSHFTGWNFGISGAEVTPYTSGGDFKTKNVQFSTSATADMKKGSVYPLDDIDGFTEGSLHHLVSTADDHGSVNIQGLLVSSNTDSTNHYVVDYTGAGPMRIANVELLDASMIFHYAPSSAAVLAEGSSFPAYPFSLGTNATMVGPDANPRVVASISGNQSIPNNTFTTLTWDTNITAQTRFPIHSTTRNTQNFVVPPGMGGLWGFSASVQVFTTNYVGVLLLKNGSAAVQPVFYAGNALSTSSATPYWQVAAVPGDVFTFQVLQNSGGASNVLGQAGPASSTMTAWRIN